jgi:hypothetical protein
MKEITVKVNSKNILNINAVKTDKRTVNQSNQTKKAQNIPNFAKFEKKVNDFGESRLRKTSNDEEVFC